MPFKILVAEDDKAISDLTLLDIMLPIVDGYELLTELKKKNIPAIFISAKTELSDKIHGLRLALSIMMKLEAWQTILTIWLKRYKTI